MADAAPSVAVTLSIAPALEDRVVDWLLARSDVGRFTSAVVDGYGAESGELSVGEQVSGRQRHTELTIELPADSVETLLEAFASAFATMEVGYRVTPILRSGRLHERVV